MEPIFLFNFSFKIKKKTYSINLKFLLHHMNIIFTLITVIYISCYININVYFDYNNLQQYDIV